MKINSPETEKPQEQLIEEARGIIYRNLLDSGLVKQIVDNSAHAQKPFAPDFYDKISLEYQMGAGSFSDGIWVTPRLATSKHLQPVTFKLERLYEEEDLRKKASKDIWSGVDASHRQALMAAAIDYQIQRNTGIIEGIPKSMSPEDAKYWIDEAKRQLTTLRILKEALIDGAVEETLDAKIASLGIRPKNVKITCENAKQPVNDHFTDAGKMIPIPNPNVARGIKKYKKEYQSRKKF